MKNTLLIDADDTLWENNIHYEKVTIDFVNLMKSKRIMEHDIERFLRQKEMANVKHYGYGADSLYRTMINVYKEACEKEGKKTENEVLVWIKNAKSKTRDYDIEFLTGVTEVLPKLQKKNLMILVTKGNPEEQKDKIKRSGVSRFFHHTRVVEEKHAKIYKDIVKELKLNIETTWMIGNSPRSDINPAKAAGLGTVFIPYHTTWEHEIEEIDTEGRETIIVDNFYGLLEYFT